MWPPGGGGVGSDEPTLGGDATVGTSGAEGAVASEAPLLPGTIVGECFRVEQVLGAGAMGVVYRAHHVKLDRPVALKLHRAGGRDEAQRLEREARAMARLSHPNVIGVYDVGTWGDRVFIAMEYVDGGTLRAWLQTPRPWRAALQMCLQAGEGLAAAHAVGLVHRDFKPENILIGRAAPGAPERARVADFGIARGTGDLGVPTTGAMPRAQTLSTTPGGATDPSFTATGAFAGTPAYMAPEQFGMPGVPVDTRADVFAFCVVAWEALYGRRPVDAASLPELVYAVTSGRIDAPPGNTGVEPAVEAVLRRGLSVRPAARPASMAVLLGELHRATSAARGPGLGAVVGAIAGVVVLVVVAAFAGYRLLSSDDVQPTASAATVEASADLAPSKAAAASGSGDAGPAADRGDTPLVIGGTDAITTETATTETGDASSEPLLDERQTAALLGAMLDPEKTDPAELMRAFLDDEELEGPVGDIVDGVFDDLAAPPEPIEITRQLEVPVWDAKTTFKCGFGDGYVLRDVQAEVAEGPALSVGQGCVLHVVDSTIAADVVAEVGGGRLLLERVTAKATTSVVHVTMIGAVDVRELRMTKRAKTALAIEGGKVLVRHSEIDAVVGVEATMSAQVRIEDSRIDAQKTALLATMSGRIEVRDTKLRGAVEHEMRGTVVQLPSTRERAR